MSLSPGQQAAYILGRHAAKTGVSCPFDGGELRDAWMQGHQDHTSSFAKIKLLIDRGIAPTLFYSTLFLLAGLVFLPPLLGYGGGGGRYGEQDWQDREEEIASTARFNDCTDDCSGHQAGYNWARRYEIADAVDCTGNSESFIEGCLTYVAEQQDDR